MIENSEGVGGREGLLRALTESLLEEESAMGAAGGPVFCKHEGTER